MEKKVTSTRIVMIVVISILFVANMAAIYYGSSIESTTSSDMSKKIAVNIYAHAEIIKPSNKNPVSEPVSSAVAEKETPEQEKQRQEKEKAEAERLEKRKEVTVARYNTRLRNLLHVLEYMSLAFFAILLCLVTVMKKSRVYMLIATVFCLFYALSDEIHQIFVDGRSFECQDLLLDFSGVVAGVILGFAIFTVIKKFLVSKN